MSIKNKHIHVIDIKNRITNYLCGHNIGINTCNFVFI